MKWGVLDNEEESVCLYGKERENYFSESGKYAFSGNKIIQSSYDTIALDIENNRFDFNDQFDLIVYDEIHTIMNSVRLTKKCKTIAKIPALRKTALTGTPIRNHPNDLGLVYLFLNNPDELSGLTERKIPVKRLEKAKNNCVLNNGLFFHFKKTKGHFQKHEMIVCLPVNQKALNFSRTILKKYPGKRKMYLSNPRSIYFRNGKHVETPFCAKAEFVRTILAEHRREKFIIFSQYIDVLYAYCDMFSKENKPAVVLTGNEKGRELMEKLELFTRSIGFNILLTTLQKSSEALNLAVANHIIILEFWWNPQKIFQAMSRIDRNDQKHPIYIYLLCYHEKGEIIKEENDVLATMENKIKDANDVYKEIYKNNDTAFDNNELQLRDLPRRAYFYDIETLKDDLSVFFRDNYKFASWDAYDYTEIDEGKSLFQTAKDILEHPQMQKWRIKKFNEAIQDAGNRIDMSGKGGK
jgi:superfamily II DNA or RNA helicase